MVDFSGRGETVFVFLIEIPEPELKISEDIERKR